MNAYIYQAAMFCEPCTAKIKAMPDARGNRPEHPEDERSFDSDDYPKGPFPDGGGESDSPQHCNDCNLYLHNPLTRDGVKYVIESLSGYTNSHRGSAEVLDQWMEELKDYSLDNSQQAILDRYNALRSIDDLRLYFDPVVKVYRSIVKCFIKLNQR